MPTEIAPTCLDFETESIESRPAYPPVPIGVAIQEWDEPGEYLAWGHKSGNSCTKAQAIKRLKAVVKSGPLLFHHEKFDLDVMETHCGIQIPHWSQTHDTTFLLFLHDPNLKNIGLKPSAEEILGWPADEKEVMADWLIEHQPVPSVKLSRGSKNEHYYMKYLAHCPGDVVGPYAVGDTARTLALFKKLYPRIIERGMSDAYDIERRLMPVLLESERRGVRVDLARLRTDVSAYQDIQDKIDAWLRKKLGTGPLFNLDSDAFVDALVSAGLADIDLMGRTKTGKVSTNKEAIANGVTDKQTAAVLQYRAQLHTCLNTFLMAWLSMAEASGGFIYSTWNQVRGEGKGARTGRLSSSPNLQNIPKLFSPLFAHEQKGLPASPIKGLLPLPRIRSYVIPYCDDHVLIDRDYNQCEIRILAHFGDGELLARYEADEWLDIHDTVKADLLRLAGLDVPRSAVKTLNFGLIFGMGVVELARRIGKTVEEAKELKKAILSLYPEIDDLYKTMRSLAKKGEPLITHGGRENYCEPPTFIKDTNKIQTWDFRMVNTLIQGSAADAAKQAAIRYHDMAPKDHLLLLTVHDEYLASVPRSELVKGHQILRAAMEGLEFDIPLLSEGSWSSTNWADLQPYDKRGVLVGDVM